MIARMRRLPNWRQRTMFLLTVAAGLTISIAFVGAICLQFAVDAVNLVRDLAGV